MLRFCDIALIPFGSRKSYFCIRRLVVTLVIFIKDKDLRNLIYVSECWQQDIDSISDHLFFVFDLGKIYQRNEADLCNDPCTFPDASIGQQMCTDNPSHWIQCKYSGKDATDLTALDGKVMDVPDDTICCPHTVWEGYVVFKNAADGGC